MSDSNDREYFLLWIGLPVTMAGRLTTLINRRHPEANVRTVRNDRHIVRATIGNHVYDLSFNYRDSKLLLHTRALCKRSWTVGLDGIGDRHLHLEISNPNADEESYQHWLVDYEHFRTAAYARRRRWQHRPKATQEVNQAITETLDLWQA